MRKIVASVIASVLAACAAMAAPAIAQGERKTDMVDTGKSVDSLLLRYAMEATWVLDDQNVLFRDTYREHYLVTLAAPCEWMDRSKAFFFFPDLTERVRASLRYEVRDGKHENCDIARLAKISKLEAQALIAKIDDKKA